MSHFNRTTFFVLLIVATITTCFGQNTAAKAQKKAKTNEEQSSRTDGLKKMTNNANRNRNIDIHIDEEALENNIDLVIENAMKSVERELKSNGVYMESIQINLSDFNVDMEAIEISISDLDINIEPGEIDFHDFDIDIDSDWDNDDSEVGNEKANDTDVEAISKASNSTINNIKEAEKRQVKSKSEKMIFKKNKNTNEIKDKSKGLKKIN